MDKNGKFFVSVVSADKFISSVWDPYVYRRDANSHTLSHFATVQKVQTKSHLLKRSPFRPIEYRDIPPGDHLSFALEPACDSDPTNLPVIGEGELIFGTMRAYLGNIIVTPMAEWINQESPVYFQIKSEFVVVCPRDELVYFWLAYMRSKGFLENLPLGSGGTRPRLQPKALAQTPVKVPPLGMRKQIHDELMKLAQAEWENYCTIIRTLNFLTHMK